METGKKIRELRIENGLKQKDLAQAVHIAANTLSQFEAGKANPSYDVLIALCLPHCGRTGIIIRLQKGKRERKTSYPRLRGRNLRSGKMMFSSVGSYKNV